MTYRVYKLFLSLLLCGVFTVAAVAQNANSTIKGTVKDVSGAVVPNASVTLTNVGTTQQRTATANGNGFYTFPNLSPGNYKLSATATGFAEWVGVLTLRVSEDAEVDAKLTAASVSTKVTVRDVTPVIDRVDPTLSDVKNATAIETMPVQNRSILSVLAFSPGVVAGSYGGSGGGYTRVNGVPGGSMDYLVDGQTMTTRWSNELQQDAQPTMTFQEVKIMTAQGDAQYSRPGEVELVTKSGTNQFHGQAYELNTNQHFQAKGYRSGATIPFEQHNEWGAQLGGPVWLPWVYNGRNKTFFFVDWEKIKDRKNAFEQYYVPTAAQRGGDFSTDNLLAGGTGDPVTIYDPTSTTATYGRTAFPGAPGAQTIPSNQLNPVAAKVLGVPTALPIISLPLPNVNVSMADIAVRGTPNLVPAALPTFTDETTFTAKLDQLLGSNRLAARYTYTNSNGISKYHTYAPTAPDSSSVGGHNISVTYTQVIGPRAINVLHGGFTYNHAFSGPLPHPNEATLLGLPVYTSPNYADQFYFDAYGTGTDYYWTPLDRNNPSDYPNQTATLSDQFSYNRGNHQLMFGFEADNTRINTFTDGQPGGNYDDFDGGFTALQNPSAPPGVNVSNTGSGLADFLLGYEPQVSVNTYPHYHTRQSELSAYAQDNWRVTPKLTATLGLRYEYWTPFADADNRYSTFDPSDPNFPGGVVVYAGSAPNEPADIVSAFENAGLNLISAATAGYPSSLITMPKDNFEPRLGFAYQLTGKTVVRGGWGIYQWVIPLQQFENASRQNPPFSWFSQINVSQVNGAITNNLAAEMELPNASAAYGGPQTPANWTLGSSALKVGTGAASISSNGGWSMAPMGPYYKPSSTQEYSLGIEHELPWHIGTQISYIGNHSYNLLQNDPINYVVPRVNCVAAGATDVAGCQAQVNGTNRPFPTFGTSGNQDYSPYTYNGYANTNELEAQVQHTFGGGLVVQAYFTWLKALTTSEDTLLGEGALTLEPAAVTPGYQLAEPLTSGSTVSQRLAYLYAPDSNLPAKTIQFNAHYVLPFGKGQRFLGNAHGVLNAIVSGFSISPFFEWHSGFPFAPYYGNGFPSSTYLAPGKTGILPKGQRTRAQWFAAGIPWDPTSGTPYKGQSYIYYGNQCLDGVLADTAYCDFPNNIPRNYMTGPGFNEMDATVYKVTPLWRNLKLDFEGQFFNIYNHINLGLPNNQGQILNSNAGSSSFANRGARTMQLQAKIVF